MPVKLKWKILKKKDFSKKKKKIFCTHGFFRQRACAFLYLRKKCVQRREWYYSEDLWNLEQKLVDNSWKGIQLFKSLSKYLQRYKKANRKVYSVFLGSYNFIISSCPCCTPCTYVFEIGVERCVCVCVCVQFQPNFFLGIRRVLCWREKTPNEIIFSSEWGLNFQSIKWSAPICLSTFLI